MKDQVYGVRKSELILEKNVKHLVQLHLKLLSVGHSIFSFPVCALESEIAIFFSNCYYKIAKCSVLFISPDIPESRRG